MKDAPARPGIRRPRSVLGRVLAATLTLGLTAPLQAWAHTPPPAPAPADRELLSSPTDLTKLPRQKNAGRVPLVAQATPGVAIIDASAAASSGGGNETSIAVNPADTKEIVITRFNGSWSGVGGSNADLLHSLDGGITWTNRATIPFHGLTDTTNGPNDQTVDFDRNGNLHGAFLTCSSATATAAFCATSHVVTGSTDDPTDATHWRWFGNPPTQATSGTRTGTDQPWLLVNRDTANAARDNAYIAMQDFGGAPDGRVAVYDGAAAAQPAGVSRDNIAGTMSPLVTNGALRLAKDPRNGTMYALYQTSTGTNQTNSVLRNQPVSVNWRLNRSTDNGQTWTLNGDTNGIVVAAENSDQGLGFKFGGVNALLGGNNHAAVDPSNGDVYVAYGADTATGNNQLRMRRLTPNGSGGLSIGGAVNISASTDAALPSVAVLDNGTIGVLYDTFDGTNTAGFPVFSAHLARSTDHGATFTDTLLQTFSSPQTDQTGCDTRPQPPNPNPPNLNCARQRVLGDYQQLKAVGNTFYGAFPGHTGGRDPVGSPPIHALFFSIPQRTETSLSSSANPSVYGQPVTFTAAVRPVPDGGTASFTVDANALGGAVPVDTTTGQATSDPIATLSVGDHTVGATYSGTTDFLGSTAAALTQTVSKAPTVTTLTSSANPSSYGRPVTFTAVVCPSGASTSPTSAPTGTVTFRDGTTVLGTGTLAPGGGTNCARAQLTHANLLPGSHTVTAQYSGDANYLAGDPASVTQTVTCTRTITGDYPRDVFASRESTCIIDANVGGTVHGIAQGALFIGNSTVDGSVLSTRGTLFAICDSLIDGSVSVARATGFVLLGDPGDDGCAANRITGGVQLSDNSSGTELVSNTIGGSVQVNGTTGSGPFPIDNRAAIVGNTIGGSLSCARNVPPPTNRGVPNTVTGTRRGQCAAL
ncbi:Ig-like domain repeat protein [Streptomyces sp. R44]|uniref:Ig-like domain repeat protein n=1 Tax=Streptomyces sp. R44 TaxID=3238633 RepID=A0AB39TBV5_9ACTN